MDTLLFHPRIVHLPMALAIIVPLAALAVALCVARGWLPRRTWWLVVGLQALLVASSLAALQSGERDEERVERFVPEAAIEAHEEAAEGFTVAGGVTLALMVLAGLLGERRFASAATAVAIAGTLAGLGLGVRVGQAGGELVYVHGAAAAHAPPGGAVPGEAPRDRRARHEDDD